MRLEALDSWRGAAALLVVLFHAPVPHSIHYADWFINMAPILDLFFMLSGFVMALSFSDKIGGVRAFVAYLIRRGGRVWPLHLAMIALLLPAPILSIITGGENPFWDWRTLDGLWRQILLIQTWSPNYALTWNFPAWTLSAEVFAYLLLGLIGLFARGPRLRIALILCIIAVSLPFFWNAMQATEDYNVISISRGVFGFFLGVALYEIWRRRPVREVMTANMLEVLAVVGVVAVFALHPDDMAYFSVYAVYALLIYTYAGDRGFVSKLIACKPLSWLATMSFSMYMLHGVVVRWMFVVVDFIQKRFDISLRDSETRMINLPEAWMNDALTLGYVALVLICTPLIYKYVEDPSRRYFTDLSRKYLGATAAKQASSGAQTAA